MQTLWVPGRLPGLNDIIEGGRGAGKGTGRAWQHEKRNWEHKIGLLAHVQGLKRFDAACFTYLFVEPNKRRDPSNFTAGGVKIIEDALQAFWVENDGWKHVLGMAKYWLCDPDNPGVFVIIGNEVLSRFQAIEIAVGVVLKDIYKGGANGHAASTASLDWSDRLGPDSAARDLSRAGKGGGRGAPAKRRGRSASAV